MSSKQSTRPSPAPLREITNEVYARGRSKVRASSLSQRSSKPMTVSRSRGRDAFLRQQRQQRNKVQRERRSVTSVRALTQAEENLFLRRISEAQNYKQTITGMRVGKIVLAITDQAKGIHTAT